LTVDPRSGPRGKLRKALPEGWNGRLKKWSKTNMEGGQ